MDEIDFLRLGEGSGLLMEDVFADLYFIFISQDILLMDK